MTAVVSILFLSFTGCVGSTIPLPLRNTCKSMPKPPEESHDDPSSPISVHVQSISAMNLSRPTNVGCFTASSSASLFPELDVDTKTKTGALRLEETKERIKKLFDKVELSVSAYDTAWVAMVPSPNSLNKPLFPECINWVLDNQHPDGSWGILHDHQLLMKATLLSTLACVLTLKRWNIGQDHMSKALSFIKSNIASATDEKQRSPVGFDIIFPGMIEYAKDLNLNLPLAPMKVDALVQKKELELRRSNSEGGKAYLAYVSEGIENLQDWEMVMQYQRKNGSLFNSPSTTAVAFMHRNDDGCFNYLRSVLQKFDDSVPTIYPLDIYARLHMVDSLQKFGIGRHFKEEIRSVLDETYRCWMQGEENIFLDASTCAMAFRLLRVEGYDVSSDKLTQFSEVLFPNCLGGHLKDFGASMELFKASQIIIYPDESILENVNSWTSRFLNHGLSGGLVRSDRTDRLVKQEAVNALEFPYNATLERLLNKRALESYSGDIVRISKTTYACLNFGHQDFLELAVEDFNTLQCIHRKELKELEKWVVENKLDKLKFARQKLAYCYFSAAATLTSPELCDARLSWAKNGVLTTVVDDFFDVGGSEEELLNLIQLVEKWDANGETGYCSKEVEIIFLALHSTVCDIGRRALSWQGRSVTRNVIDIWLALLESMRKEAEWLKNKVVPSMDEYMENGYVSFALGPIVLPTLYFVGPKLPEEVIGNCEYKKLFKLMSTCGRLLNDTRTFDRESSEGKLNAMSLCIINAGGKLTKEEATEAMKGDVERTRRELLRLVLQENTTIPRACKDLFRKMSCVVHLFYRKDDGFTSHELMKSAKALFEQPMVLDQLLNK
ncbi:ent-kaur-16-ene synthase, chloroplastic isoform X2 [Benincasa hispida]|uniref:ent-kaur-16-ene synthase, chloroplastic isoform X2 n=1 Tax=Benincasa hispida TaxID=102211 RepID=UPI0018FFCE03|nr:ent-kaur-16-ene synthase, chloroplastic isoform X2 [Benincasa hispida]